MGTFIRACGKALSNMAPITVDCEVLRYEHIYTSFEQQNTMTPILQKETEAEREAQSYTGSMWQNRELNLNLPNPRLVCHPLNILLLNTF